MQEVAEYVLERFEFSYQLEMLAYTVERTERELPVPEDLTKVRRSSMALLEGSEASGY